MGNDQSDLNYTSCNEEADSGLGSPIEENLSKDSHFFDDPDSSGMPSDPHITSTPVKKRLMNVADEVMEEPPEKLLQRRPSSFVRSNTIDITRSFNNKINITDFEIEATDNFDCEVPCGSLKSRQSNVSILSTSWSPNSNIPKPKIELVKSKSASENTSPSKSYQLTNSFVSGMNFVGRVAKGVKDFYNEINPATLTGAIDVVVVKQEDGTFRSSPFHVRFGKLGVIRSKEKIVDIEINGQKVDDLHMVLGEAGEAFFIERISNSGEIELSNCTEFENCNLPPDAPILTSSESHDENLSSLVESRQLLMEASKNEQQTINMVNLEKTGLNSELIVEVNEEPIKNLTETTHESFTNPIPISKSTPMIYQTEPDSSLSPLISPVTTQNIKNLEVAKTNLNFFSDGDITPELTSPAYSRPSTPRSDTEVEIAKFKRDTLVSASGPTTSDANQWNWSWGQFPERQNPKEKGLKKEDSLDKVSQVSVEEINSVGETNTNKDSQLEVNSQSTIKSKDNKSSSKILDGMLSLVSKNSAKSTSDGIYLDDTDKLDSEVADLYLNQKGRKSAGLVATTSTVALKIASQSHLHNDDDQESGNGLSLPQSPVNGPLLGDIQLSLCGFMPLATSVSTNASPKSVSQTNISTEENVSLPSQTPPRSPLAATPTPFVQSLSTSPNTQNSNMNKELSLQLPSSSTPLTNGDNFDDLFQQYAVSFDKFMTEITTITMNPNLVIKINNQYMNWQSAAPIILSAIVFQRPLPSDSIKTIMETNMPQPEKPVEADKKTGGWGSNLFYWGNTSKKETTTTTTEVITVDHEEYGAMFKEDWSKTVQVEVKNEAECTLVNETSVPECKSIYKHRTTTTTSVDYNEFTLKKELYRKSTRLSSAIIEKLNLQMGSNEIEYSITTALQGTTRITSYIFLWNYDDKIIVSDIDGTITKSDVWGQVLPIFGRDWSQDGVADLFTAIERNQYKFMYLSARAIGQSKITRDLLKNINQNGYTLPEGPLLVTPTSLFVAFQKEVIERKPEEFKISCLSDIKALFPAENEVFYAGYGNKPTDVTAYKTVGMPISRIFTINPQGEVKHEVSRTFQSSYTKLCDYVDLIFPPFRPQRKESKLDYHDFSYWRAGSIMDVDSEIEEHLLKETSKENTKTKGKSQSLNTSLQNNSSSSQANESSDQAKS